MPEPHIAIVTGGTGTIGTAICRALAADGHRVIAIGHPSESDQLAAWQTTNADVEAGYLCDLANFSDTHSTFEAIRDAHGPVAILVNAAGITRDAPLKRMDADSWSTVIAANLDSVFNCTRSVIESMLSAKHGRIVNIASINGQKGQFGQANYSAAKAGMHGFTMAVAQEGARHNVTVNTVSPGYIDSPMIQAVPDAVRDKIRDGIPVGRFGTPGDIARTVAFLAADEAGYLTGANIPVNGGQFMH